MFSFRIKRLFVTSFVLHFFLSILESVRRAAFALWWQAFKHGLAPAVFDHPDWEDSPEIAVSESIHKIERALLGEQAL